MIDNICISKITVRRAIYILEGEVQASDVDAFNIIMVEAGGLTYKPTIVECADNKIKIYINVESANHEMPLNSGKYFLKAFDDRPVKYDGEAVSLEIFKSEQEYIKCNAQKEGEAFVLEVESRLPKYEQKNAIKRALQKSFVIAYKCMRVFAKNKGNKILFASASRSQLSGNEKFVYDKLVSMGLADNFDIVFDYKPSVSRTYSPLKMLRFTYRLATSDVIFVDDYYPEISKIDFPQKVAIFQLWHACGAFKTIGLERLTKPGAPALNTRVHKQYTHVPVSSDLVAKHYQEAYGIDFDKMYPVGVPRTDIFFDEEYERTICQDIISKYPMLDNSSQTFLYAPTFRGLSAVDAYFPIEVIDLERIGELCKRKNARFIIKLHPFVKDRMTIPEEYKEYIIDMSDEREVNDLLFITNVLITDYSSVMYEFSLLNRDTVFFAFDRDEYIRDRDFYEPYEETISGKVVLEFEELLRVLEQDDYDRQAMNAFVDKNFKYKDGKASERVVELMLEWLKEKYEIQY